MFNPDFKNKKVNYEMIQASIKSLTFIIILFCIYATCNVIKTIIWNIIIIEYKSLDIYIMVSLLVTTALIIFISFKGLADDLNTIFIKLNDIIIEKDKKIKELEEKLVTNNIQTSKLQDENINNLTNLFKNLNIEESVTPESVEENIRPKRYRKMRQFYNL
jgi:hypothetical protein